MAVPDADAAHLTSDSFGRWLFVSGAAEKVFESSQPVN